MSRMSGGEARVCFGAGFLRQDTDAATQIWTEVGPRKLPSSSSALPKKYNTCLLHLLRPLFQPGTFRDGCRNLFLLVAYR
jgi:hypothetical protein